MQAPPLKILLADDEPLSRETIADLLRSLGHEIVATANTGREAIAVAASTEADVVLLDVHMPEGTGVEAAREIASNSPGIAIVLYSGDPHLRLTAEDAAETSAIAFLSKPATPASLDGTLRLAAARARSLHTAHDDAKQARRILEERKTIERAKGILMRRTGCSEPEAWSILRRSSQDNAKPMIEIARAVIASEP